MDTPTDRKVKAYSKRLLKLLELTEELQAVFEKHEDSERYAHIQELMEFHSLELALMARGWEHLGDRPVVGLFNGGRLEITIPKDLS